MRVHIHRNAGTFSVGIYVIDDRPRPALARLDDKGCVAEWEPLAWNVSLPDEPTLHLDGEVFDAIVLEAVKVTQASDATVEALADTRAVRDRLFSLVERLVP